MSVPTGGSSYDFKSSSASTATQGPYNADFGGTWHVSTKGSGNGLPDWLVLAGIGAAALALVAVVKYLK